MYMDISSHGTNHQPAPLGANTPPHTYTPKFSLFKATFAISILSIGIFLVGRFLGMRASLSNSIKAVPLALCGCMIYRYWHTHWAARENTKNLSHSKGSQNSSLLFASIEKGDEETARMLIDQSVDLNARDRHGNTMLMLAAMYGQENIVQMLIEASIQSGVDPTAYLNNAFDKKNGYTPLMLAAMYGHDKTIKVLIKGGANLEICGRHGRNALVVATRYGHAKVVEALLEETDANLLNDLLTARTSDSGATVFTTAATRAQGPIIQMLIEACMQAGVDHIVHLNAKNNNSQTPLMIAAIKGYEGIVQELIKEAGIELNAHDDDGHTALTLAKIHEKNHIERMLIQVNAMETKQADSEAQVNTLNTPLICALLNNDLKTAEIIIDQVSINRNLLKALLQDCDKQGNTPFMLAAMNGRQKIVEIMMNKAGVDLDLLSTLFQACNNDGFTAFMLAIINGRQKLVELMMGQAGAHFDLLQALFTTHNKQGNTPLMFAAMNGRHKILTLMIDQAERAGADLLKTLLEACNHDGFTALAHAITWESARLLHVQPLVNAHVKAGVALNPKNNLGDTPLILAVRVWKGKEMIRMLIDTNRHMLEDKDMKGHTAFMLAAMHGKEEIVRMLAAAGANINAHSKDGYTALAYEIIARSPETEMARILREELQASQTFADIVLNINEVAHMWGIGGNVSVTTGEMGNVTIETEGTYAKFMLRLLLEYAADFFKLNPLVLKKEHQIEIQECIASAFPLSREINPDVIKKIKSGAPFTPIMILGGSCTHAVSVLICRNIHSKLENKIEMIMCNRGDGMRTKAVERYSLDPSRVDEAIKLLKHADDMGLFNDKILRMKGSLSPDSTPILTYIGGYDQKSQKTGNCGWASPKGTFGVLCRLYTNGLEDEVHEIYKKFTIFTRERALGKYLRSSHPNRELILKILGKYIGKVMPSNELRSQLKEMFQTPSKELIFNLLGQLETAKRARLKRIGHWAGGQQAEEALYATLEHWLRNHSLSLKAPAIQEAKLKE